MRGWRWGVVADRSATHRQPKKNVHSQPARKYLLEAAGCRWVKLVTKRLLHLELFMAVIGHGAPQTNH